MSRVARYLVRKLFDHPLYIVIFVLGLTETLFNVIGIPLILSAAAERGYEAWMGMSFCGYLLLALISYRAWHYLDDVILGPSIRREVIAESMEVLIGRDFPYHEKNPPAALVAKIGFLEKTHDTIMLTFNEILTHFIAILVFLYFMLRERSVIFFPVAIWFLFLLFCLSFMSSSYVRKLAFEAANIYSKNTGRRVNILGNMFNIKLFSNCYKEMNFIKKDLNFELKTRADYENIMFWIWTINWSIFTATVCCIIGYISYKGCTGGQFALIMGMLLQIMHPIAMIMFKWSDAMNNLAQIGVALNDLYMEQNSQLNNHSSDNKKIGTLFS